MRSPQLLPAGLFLCLAALAFDGDSFSAKFDALPKAVQNDFPVSISSSKSDQGWD